MRVSLRTSSGNVGYIFHNGDSKDVFGGAASGCNQERDPIDRTQPNGLETLTNGEMDAIAQTIVNMNAEYIITDHEGAAA